jgi:putative PIN family toxin of toxin-antitoxin system
MSFRELDKAIQKSYLAKRISRKLYEKLVTRLRKNAELVDVHSVVEVCRDPKDNFLLALAKDGNADYLITGDDDLLVLKTFGNTKIITLTDFEVAHG